MTDGPAGGYRDALGAVVAADPFGTCREFRLGSASRRVFVVDGALPEAERTRAYEYLKSLDYRFNLGDRSDTRYLLHWSRGFDDAELDSNLVLRSLLSAAQRFARARGLTFARIERVYANLTLYGDVQLVHDDGDIWTALYFANSVWEPDWGGELHFYGDSPDLSIAIQPRPGRLVVFDGLLPHRAGVPSKLCLEPRITVALKFRRPPCESPTT
jgi:SM-20-related protein